MPGKINRRIIICKYNFVKPLINRIYPLPRRNIIRILIAEKDAIEYLLMDNSLMDKDKMFHLKMLEIQKNWGLKPTDDLGIIRLCR